MYNRMLIYIVAGTLRCRHHVNHVVVGIHRDRLWHVHGHLWYAHGRHHPWRAMRRLHI